ncbi:hypothetical protein [Carboxylicivirga sp. M1479]|uniref:hypothetical protein n=1 Tax=Carboxylicivirga sp. M1479 TaxID=2594476 RepID=UPI0011779C64|nr:hypothetical protein [Carboxylicivirga sp. M1479]TRX71247.1 hypothetical protein FNN09_07490 [Carboxylicivirga sp. M1479]
MGLKGLLGGVVACLLFVSCELNDKIEEESKTTVALDALAEFSEVAIHFHGASKTCREGLLMAEGDALKSVSGSDPIITVKKLSESNWPVLITVDYGLGIQCTDGIVRKGKVLIESTGWYKHENSVHVATFQNYYQNGYQLEGLHIETCDGQNEQGNFYFDVEVKNGVITSPLGKRIEYSQTSTREWIKGSDTPLDINDDEYLIEGSQNGTSSKGTNFFMHVEEPLHWIMDPHHIASGTLLVNAGEINGIEVNYSTKQITIGAMTYPID